MTSKIILSAPNLLPLFTTRLISFTKLSTPRINLCYPCVFKQTYVTERLIIIIIEKTKEYEGDNYTNCDWSFWHGNSRIIKGPGRFESWRPSGDRPNNSITENGQNSEKSPGDLRRLAVTQPPVKDHQLTPM